MVTFNGRITLPSNVRRELGLKTGDSIDFVELGNGQFAIKPRGLSVLRMKGCASKMDTSLTSVADESMDEAEQGVVVED
jgi:AbrB family looped-hinge helix DNA binding protein